MTIELQQWQMKDFAPGEGSAESHGDWISVSAPGDTYLALHAAGRIPHPYADDNEKACAWVEGREWWWRTAFKSTKPSRGERAILVFEGLDTFASIWVNGKQVATTDNMFRGYRFDISEILHEGDNTLAVRFTPPSVVTQSMPLKAFPGGAGSQLVESKRNMIRKAQFGWGWDWGPCFPTTGIWKPVRIVRETNAALRDVRFTTLNLSCRVRVGLDVDVFAATERVTADILITGPDGETVARSVLDVKRESVSEFAVSNPKLWWTRELGAQPLYQLSVRLWHGDHVVDSRTLNVGIRTIALDTSPDPGEPGTEFFRFVLNGVPIFAKGVNWIPASSFVGALTDADYARLLEDAADANMNMIRIWGGGVYEPDIFYALCDRLGLLVWQDFMFACAPYPEGDDAFLKNVEAEIRHQVKRLRNHPSMALWCGNNEGQAIHEFACHVLNSREPYEGEKLFATIIAGIVDEHDPNTPYWPGSPFGGALANSMKKGDVHDWTVWHGVPPIPGDVIEGAVDRSPAGVAYTRYAEDMSRFVSEYGIQASPALCTLSRWVERDGLSLNGEAFLNRVKDNPKNKVDGMLTTVTGLPETLEQYADFTQITQAEGLKFAIEHFRRRKPHCSGSLIWQYNDCWPGISWSIVDYDGVAKAGYDFVRRAYAPVLGSFKGLEDGSVEFWISNDTMKAQEIACRLTLLSVKGGEVWHEDVKASVGANESVRVWLAGPDKLGAAADRVLTARAKEFPANRHFFAAIKDVPFADAVPQMRVEQLDEHSLQAILTGNTYHYGVRLAAPHAATHYSDNCFDMMRGEVRTIVVRNTQIELSPGELHVRTLLRHV